jgi:hypothetical protein
MIATLATTKILKKKMVYIVQFFTRIGGEAGIRQNLGCDEY